MTSPTKAWPLSVLLLLAALSGCGSPKPTAEPAAGANPPVRPAPASTTTNARSAQHELDQTLSSANDLFNRGENDLACDQVKRATQSSPSFRTAAQQEQLERYKAACESL
jgi:hypothetical protein